MQDESMPVLPDNPPDMRRAGVGKWEGPCPYRGGTNRIQIVEGERIWCRHCDTVKFLRGKEFSTRKTPYQYVVPPESKIPQGIALQYHKALKPEHRNYFRGRGISDEWIDRALLGWREDWKRYSIPCFYQGRLYAMQYRASLPGQEVRYISEAGSFSDLLYGGEDFTKRKPMFVVVVEAPLDRLALESHGIPAVARFCGNNVAHSWHREFTKVIGSAIDKIIVADNDKSGIGILYADLKREQIPGSRVVLPKLRKDIGEYYKDGLSAEVPLLLGLPAAR